MKFFVMHIIHIYAYICIDVNMYHAFSTNPLKPSKELRRDLSIVQGADLGARRGHRRQANEGGGQNFTSPKVNR